MNAEQVVKKILSEAHEQAEAIAQDAQQKRQRQTQQLDEELSAYRAETERLANAAAEDRRSRMLAAARMENARALLAAKADLLDEVFGKAQERVVKLPDEQYRSVMMRLMQKAVETGDEEVIVGKAERRIDDGFIKQVNRSLVRALGQPAAQRPARRHQGRIYPARGKVRMNAGVEVLVERLRESLETELAARLFG